MASTSLTWHPLRIPLMVLPTVADTLGLRQGSDRPLIEDLRDSLASKRVLLVLDNFEQVIPAAPVVTELLQTTPLLKILVTSRELLRVTGEHNFPVPPLSLPPVLADQGTPRMLAPLSAERIRDYAAVQLFVQRAEALRHDFALTPDNALSVAGICSRLDGLPLAIELAAARVRHIPPQDIYDRLVNRLHVLTAGARDLPQRQRSLRTAIEWSYGLLEPDEATLFRRLAVFHNGVTLEAGEAVTLPSDAVETDTLSLISSLLDKSLLRQVEGAGQAPRYLMLETIHDYAWEKLDESGEAELMRRSHADYFVALAEQAEPELRGSQQKLWMERLEDEHDNLRAALRWALTNDKAEIAGRLGSALWRFWERRSHLSEGRRWLEQVLALGVRVPASMRAKMLAASGFLAFRQSDYGAGRSLEEESLSIYRELGDKTGIALSFTFLADLEYALGDPIPGMALTRFEQALALWREAGDPWGIAKALSDLGEGARTIGDYQAARARYEESLTIRRELNDQSSIAVDLVNLAHVADHEGNYEQARQLFLEGLLIGNDLGNWHTMSIALGGLAGLAVRDGRPRRAALLFGSAEAALRSVAGGLDPVDRAALESNLSAARAQLDEATWETLWTEGQNMTLDQASAFARSNPEADAAAIPRAQPGGLTRREREIAQLVAQGKSNREIGDVLVIAERTVEGHVSNILSKLGFRSRAQISVWVVENGLADR